MLKPTRNLVGIAPKYESDKIKTESGITLFKHESYKGRTVQGIVKYVADGVKELQVGDYVFYSAYSGQLWSWKGELVIFMEESEVLCKVWNIPDTSINGLYLREKIDKEKNYKVLLDLYKEWIQGLQGNKSLELGPGGAEFAMFLADKIDAYGAYFEAPFEQAIELITKTLQEKEWTNTVQVGDTVQPLNPDLYKDEKLICDVCGGKEQQLRERSTTRIFYRCSNCGRVRDRRMIKEVEA